MKEEYYKIELEIKGLIPPERIVRMEMLTDREVFFSEADTIVQGRITDQSALTAFLKQLRDSGLAILRVNCEKSEDV